MSPRHLSTNGSRTASSTPRTTVSSATCRAATPTRPRSSSRPTMGRSRVSTIRSSITGCAGWRTALSRAASKRAIGSSSTSRCRSKASSRCRPAPGSARRTRSCSAVFPPNRYTNGSLTPARSRSSAPTSRCAAASRWRSRRSSTKRLAWAGARPSRPSSSTGVPVTQCRWRRDVTCGCTSWSQTSPRPASRYGSARSTPCSSFTRRARRAPRRGCSTRLAATCCGPRSR